MMLVVVVAISDYFHQKLSQKVNFILPSDGERDADGEVGGSLLGETDGDADGECGDIVEAHTS
jgi:hypothetical protein